MTPDTHVPRQVLTPWQHNGRQLEDKPAHISTSWAEISQAARCRLGCWLWPYVSSVRVSEGGKKCRALARMQSPPLLMAMELVRGTSTLPRKRALAMTLLGSCDSFCSCLAPRVPPMSHSSSCSSEAALTSLHVPSPSREAACWHNTQTITQAQLSQADNIPAMTHRLSRARPASEPSTLSLGSPPRKKVAGGTPDRFQFYGHHSL